MQKLVLALVTTAALWGAACGGGGGGGGGGSSSSSGPVTAPTPPAQTQPAGVNVNSQATVNGQMFQVLWAGDVSFNEQTGTNTINFPQLTQNGSQVSGQINFYGPDGGAGPFAGVVSGTTLTFNFSIGNQGQGCGNTISGSANVTTSTMVATFSGHRCNGTPYTNGKFTVSIPAVFRTSPYSVGGIWTTVTPPVLGGGRWTFNISEAPVDVNGSNVTGSVVVNGGTLNLGSGSLTGTVTNTFPGPTTIAKMTVTFAGACPSTLTFTEGFPGANPSFDGSQMTGGETGTTCNGPSQAGLNLMRQ